MRRPRLDTPPIGFDEKSKSVKLCLQRRDWDSGQLIADTYVPWAMEWRPSSSSFGWQQESGSVAASTSYRPAIATAHLDMAENKGIGPVPLERINERS